MSTLKENLQEIKRQKDTYLKPENIKKGVKVFGITGTLDSSGGVDYSNNNYEVVDGKLKFKKVFGKTGFENDLYELDIPEEIEFVIQKNKDDIVFYLEETTTTSSGFYLTIYVKNNKTDKFYLSNTSYYGDDKFIIGKDYTLRDTLGENNYDGITLFIGNGIDEVSQDNASWKKYDIYYRLPDLTISSSSNSTGYYDSMSPYYRQILCAATDEISADWVCSDFFKWADIYNTDSEMGGKTIHYITPKVSVYDKVVNSSDNYIDITDDMIPSSGLPATVVNPGGTYAENVTEELFPTKVKWYKNDNNTYGIAVVTPWTAAISDLSFSYIGTNYSYVTFSDNPGVQIIFNWLNSGNQVLDDESAGSQVVYNADICELNKDLETELNSVEVKIYCSVEMQERIW